MAPLPTVQPPPTKRWMKAFRQYESSLSESSRHSSTTRRKSKSLNNWVATQRKEYRRYTSGKPTQMTATKVELLQSIGFPLCVRGVASPTSPNTTLEDIVSKKWFMSFQELSRYKQEKGTFSIAKRADNPSLYDWLFVQRRDNRRGILPPVRRTLLYLLGLLLPFFDHIGREYYSTKQFKSPREYVCHRFGSMDSNYESDEFVGLHEVLKEPIPSLADLKLSSVAWNHPDCFSICLRPNIDNDIIENAKLCCPLSVFPDDPTTAAPEQMAQKMSACKELDDIHVLEGGSRLPRVRLNEQKYAQPRRISWSTVVQDKHRKEGSTADLYTLFSYSQSYRVPVDWRGRPMPRNIYNLGVELWKAAFPYLSPISQVCPPTHCQVMIYHSSFEGKVGIHRDNGLLNPNDKHGRLGHSADENSQIRGSSVLGFTIGAPMNFYLMHPPLSPTSIFKEKKVNYVKEEDLTIPLSEGSLFVLDPRDDENFIHTACFDSSAHKENQVRISFMFRWLSKQHEFYADDSDHPCQRAS